MKFFEICIRRPVLASMLNLALVLFGLVSLSILPVRELPDVDPPIVTVTTVYPGASARVVETEVTEKLEDVISSIEGIKKLTSESREQVSAITIEFTLAREIEISAQDVRDRVARARGNLPDDIDEPIVAKQEADASPMMWVSLASQEITPTGLTRLAEDVIRDRLQTVEGVSSIMIGGAKRFAIRIRLDSEKMAAHQLTVLDVQQALREQNVELPSGRVENLERELAVETRGDLRTAEEFNRLVVFRDGSNFVRLSDIGIAEEGVEDERSIARFNSNPTIGLGVVRQSKANTIQVAHGVRQEMENIMPMLPEGIITSYAYDESIYISEAIYQVWLTLIVAFILVVLTIFLFLGDIRATIIPSISIPVSIIGTFAVLNLMGYSINILTMLALVLAIGIVVDDSIVVLENIFRYIEKGLKPLDAAITGIKEIAFAVVATTLALVSVFVPLSFQTSITGRLFIEFAIALSGAVVISSFVALSLTPMIASRALRQKDLAQREGSFKRFGAFFSRLTEKYSRGLKWSLVNRGKVLLGAAASVAIGLFFFAQLASEFLPDEDKGRLLNFLIAPEGSTSEYTDRMVGKMEEIAAETPEIAGYFSAVALPFAGPGRANQGLMFVRLKEDRSKGVLDIVRGPHGLGAKFFGQIEGAIAIPIIPKAIGGGFSQPFQLVIQHQNLEELDEFTRSFIARLQREGDLFNIRSTFEFNKPELRVNIDRDRAAVLDVSIADVARSLQILFGGLDLSKIQVEGREYDVIVQLGRESRLTPADLDKVYVRNQAGTLIQLSNLASYETLAGPNAINRYNRLRSATIEGTPTGMPIGMLMDKVEGMLAEELPAGFNFAWSGEAEDLEETTRNTLFIFLLAIVIVYMVLASQFESLVHPLTVLCALPLAAFGAFGALWLLDMVNGLGTMLYGWANYAPDPPWIAGVLSYLVPRIPAMTINLFSQIGMILLLGLVTKNAILLVEFANQKMAQGMSAREAMAEAGVIRFRPIIMTALGTIIGIMPLVIGFGAGAESRRPMGVAIVGGMATSTILTLLVIPVLYTVFSDMGQWVKNKRH